MNIITIQITNQNNVIGGAYDRYMILINTFLKKGFKVHHISPRGFSNIEHEKLIHHGVLKSPFSPKFMFFFIQSIYKMFQIRFNHKIDLIIAFSPLEAILGIFYKLLSRKTKLIVSFRCDSVASCSIMENSFKKSISIYLINFIDKLAIKNADQVIFISKKNKNDILKRTNIKSTEKIKIVYNGITPRLKELSKEDGVNFFDGKKIIGYVGLLFPAKGVKYLVEAFSKLLKKDPNLKLVIVGDGPDKKSLQDMSCRLNIEDRIVFTGYQKNPIKYIKGFDVLVVPSLVEPFGIVILEAFYVETPVIGSCVGGITEILRYNELLFQPKNSDDLKAKLSEMLDNKDSYKKVVELCKERSQFFRKDWAMEMMSVILNVNDE
jgi:glycosyltransferase involved in cell wall biosynthesis